MTKSKTPNGKEEIDSKPPSTPKPDIRLRVLDRLVGTWTLHHRDVDTGEEWGGQDTFEWMSGGFFLAFRHEEFGRNIKGVMLIGYERKYGAANSSPNLMGHCFESSSGNHFEYTWEVDDDSVTFWLGNRNSSSAFKGSWSDDHNKITGRWRWAGGGYELTMTRA